MRDVFEILDKMQFFQGQRAGRELWSGKPKDVQDADIEQFNADIETLREYIKKSPRDWTPCAEGLPHLTADGRYPEVRVTYRTLCGNLEVTDAVYMPEYDEWVEVRHDDQYDLENVIAWKPHDEPYNPDRKEDAE